MVTVMGEAAMEAWIRDDLVVVQLSDFGCDPIASRILFGLVDAHFDIKIGRFDGCGPILTAVIKIFAFVAK